MGYTSILRRLLVENPELPIKFFIGDNVNDGEFSSVLATPSEIRITEITLYNDKYYENDSDLEDIIYDNLDDDISEEEADKEIERIINSLDWNEIIMVNFN